MDRNDIAALAKGMVPFVREVVTEAMAPLVARLVELEARPVLKGDPGEQGAEGPQGLVGPPGPLGPEGPVGQKGDPGEPGANGEQGWSGDKGEKGEAGRDGRDAADLMLLFRHVEEQVAAVVAGMVNTMSITSPDSGRTLLAAFGDRIHEIKTGIPLYRGVWKDGTYPAGDSVSHGGSLFIAKVETVEKPGNTSGEWQLSVKRGADGRDFRPEEKRASDVVRFK